MPASKDADNTLIEKILWKLGSPLRAPTPSNAGLDGHISRLMSAVTTDYPDEESRMIAIRNSGINMFVELEELLRSASEFTCWALLNDHYDMRPFDRFRYSKNRARVFSQKIFGDEAAVRGASFLYDPTGANALSVLRSSFRVQAEICETHLSNSENYLRPAWQIPSFANHGDVQKFPLHHTVLFLDLRPECQRRLIDSLRSVTLALTRTDICEIRNSLGHPRESFPSNEALLDAIAAIRSALGFLSSEGLLVIVRKYAGETIDKFNRRRIRMTDGRGDEVVLTAPNQLMMLDLPSYAVPQVVIRDALFAASLQPARFEAADDSEWSEMWHNVGFIDSWLNRDGTVVVSDGVTEDLVANEVPARNTASGTQTSGQYKSL